MPVALPLAVVGAGVASAAIGAGAAKSAANTQAQAAQQATNVQQQMYNTTRGDLAPFRSTGASFLPGLQALLGVDASGNPVSGAQPKAGDPNFALWADENPDIRKYYDATPAAQAAYPNFLDFAKSIAGQQAANRIAVPTYSASDVANMPTPQETALENIPGYKFARDQGVQQVARALGSTGQTGAQAKGIARFVTGLADQTYGEQFNRLLQGANLGETAAAQTGNIGASYAGGISNTITGAGTAQAAGTVGAANAISGGLSTIPSSLILNRILSGAGGSGGGGSNSQYGDLALGNVPI